jgi:outer membrane protein TolC
MLGRLRKRLLRRWWKVAVGALVAAAAAASPPEYAAPTARFGDVIEIDAKGNERTVRPEVAEREIDLAAAFRLAGIDNPTIALAQERIQEALADQLAARSLLLPSLNAGSNYRNHAGYYQDDPGFLRNPHTQSLYLGAGAGAIGAGAVTVPGVFLFAHLGDAAYEPLAARQRVLARSSEAHAVQNSVLSEVAVAYLQLVEAQRRRDILRSAETDIARIADITAAFAKTGQGAPADARRSVANLELVRRQLLEADGAIDAVTARLAQLLSLDPSIRIRVPDGSIDMIRLVPEDADLETLVTAAVRFRPELAARSADVQEAQIQVRQERVRPFLPLVAIGFSSGVFGGGSNQVATDFGPLQPRVDFTVVAVWDLQNLGFGNRARVSGARAVMGQATAELDVEVNRVRREVAEALAGARASAKQYDIIRTSLATAEEGFRLDSERIRLGQGRPIEVLDSFRQLFDARLDVLRTMIEFDIWQMRLWVALGSDPSASANLR